MANFQAIAMQIVIAEAALRSVVARIGRLVASIQGAADAVVAVWGSSGRASSAEASLRTVAMQAIVAMRVGQTVHTGISVLVAKRGWSAWVGGVRTSTRGITNFSTIAIVAILAGIMVGCVSATVSRFVARINSTGNPVGTIGRSSGLTNPVYTRLDTIAMLSVVAMLVG